MSQDRVGYRRGAGYCKRCRRYLHVDEIRVSQTAQTYRFRCIYCNGPVRLKPRRKRISRNFK